MAARVSPADFAHYASRGRWQYARHLDYLNTALMDLIWGDLRVLVVCMPIRHGKSLLISKYFPAWYLCTHPDCRVMMLSSEADLAKGFGAASRNVVAEWGPVFGVELDQSTRSKTEWKISGRDGNMFSKGIGGGIQGRGGDLLICDDLIRSWKQVHSKNGRDDAWHFFQQARQRQEPDARLVLVQSRWHEADPAGLLIRQIEAGIIAKARVISMPALAEDDDPLGREPGDALWPERWPREALLERKTSTEHEEIRGGPYWWDANYQQRPVPAEGAIFKRQWFRYYENGGAKFRLWRDPEAEPEELDPKDCMRFCTVDLAVSKKDTADFFALGQWYLSRKKRDLVLHDCVHDRIEGPDQPDVIERVFREFRPSLVYVESNAYQLSLVQQLLRKGIRVKGVRTTSDKEARAHGAATMFANSKVFFDRRARWVSELEEELLMFPAGSHDDYVDIISMAVDQMPNLVMPSVH